MFAGLLFWGPVALVLAVGLVALSVIDYRHHLLPNRIVYPLWSLGILTCIVQPLPGLDRADCCIGSVAAFLLTWLIRAVGSYFAKREAMGFGDVKFMGMAGAFAGWQAINFIFFVAASSTGIALLLLRHRGMRKGLQFEMPFGPGLCLGLLIVVLARLLGADVNPAWPL